MVLSALQSRLATPVVKSAAFDSEVLGNHPLPAELILGEKGGERAVTCDTRWLEGIDTAADLVFAGYRTEGLRRFCVVVSCDPASDRLVLLPLEEHETPVQALDAPRRDELRQAVEGAENAGDGRLVVVSLRSAIDDKLLGPPLPTPRRVFAVAANSPSHLRHDLAIDGEKLGANDTPPRVFLKFPQTEPPGVSVSGAEFSGVVGPFDPIRYPSRIALPAHGAGGAPSDTETRLDYEVEVGAVIGRTLTWDSIRDSGDDELRAAVAGYVLVSDSKARNPQVLLKVAGHSRPAQSALARGLGSWDVETCRWWSFASSYGDYAAMGPFFVAARANPTFPPRAVLTARSYAAAEERGIPAPKNCETGQLYLRQCSVATESENHPDAMLWNVPRIVRAILDPGGALSFIEETLRLEPGDVICLGTPGGTVITSKSQRLVSFLDTVVFWWDPLDWHDAFFSRDAGLYLRNGDELFFWAEGLGYQHHLVSQVEVGGYGVGPGS